VIITLSGRVYKLTKLTGRLGEWEFEREWQQKRTVHYLPHMNVASERVRECESKSAFECECQCECKRE